MEKNNLLFVLDKLAHTDIKGIAGNIDDAFKDTQQTLEEAVPNIFTLSELQHLSKSEKLTINDHTSYEKFIFLSLECLLRLKGCLEREEDETGRLLSVAHQRSVRLLLDHIVNLGVWPNLLPGVSPPVNLGTGSDLQNSFSDFEKYKCLCLVTSGLVELYHNDTLHGIILPQFLTPLMCSLCQLTMGPLKKSSDTYLQLQKERLVYQHHLDNVLNKLYQPMVIKELMIIEGNRKSPKWLKQGVGRLLTQQLHRPHGVLATLNAVRDAANCAAPNTSTHLESVARVITASPALNVICPQILEVLDSKEAEIIKVGVICVKTLHNRDPDACESHLLQPITRPLLNAASEQEVTVSLQRLHRCFSVPASDLWCLPVELLTPYIHVLFSLYTKVYQSVSSVRQTVEDLVWRFLSKCKEPMLNVILRCLLYRERVSGVHIKDGLEFVFGDDGGVQHIESDVEHSLEEFGDCLMILLERRDNSGMLGNKLFTTLLEFSSEKKECTIDGFEQQLVTLKLLAVLSENAEVQKSLSMNPQPVVNFLKTMIERHSHNEENVEIICLVLVVLNVILNDSIHSKSVNWKLFSPLEEPLLKLKGEAKSTELQMLAEEAYEVITSRGVVRSKNNIASNQKTRQNKPPEIKSAAAEKDLFREALRDSCDPLLPVRGHALIQLGKLLASGDKLAKVKKDQILCIFQENLREEDSFLYLSAIEGLSTAAAEFPDSVILSLTEQFSRRTLKPETRMKVGEALVKVIKVLGDLTPVYKSELINTFLSGTREDDFLVRASSLSNLGELCRVLGFRVGPIIAEVLMCVRCIAQSDPSVEVRRAAVMLVSLLLKGLEKDVLTVLQDVLLELYHTLKHIYNNDRDDVTRLHAQLALEELNAGTLMFLFPKPQLTKQIFVLDPPS
ncbi:transport and Golgi organization protein 6 homolog [Macrosteles quadrilineatus]|uniref:transport and Golgi organization protein 6 homolog n=1 Tax=Macrosteles quadrilineatus TaxID=74068 RepID=UPI0023E092D8|nr:transport and Golgi organization protein 6 homolog [Macrosteles quadrilineatus]